MKRYLYSLVALAFLAGSCSDNTPDFPTNSSVEESDESRISSFDINPAMLDGEMISKIGYANLKKGFFNLETYHAELRHLGSSVRCGLHLGTASNLEDGVYLLTFSDTDGKPLEGMLRIEVKEDQVMKVSEAKSSFSLRSGSGTKEDPYRIGSARDFLMFLDDLRENELTNGRDVWFQQTADIELMDQSSTKPGRGYFGYSFAGHYNGGGYALKGMYYRGAENAESDTRVGIFPSLLDGATVENLTISGVNLSATYADTGTLAGTVAGTVSISGIKMTGSVISDKATNVGAFIGRLEKGSFTATDMKLCGSVKGGKNVGGIIGCVEKGDAEFCNIETPESHFLVEGYECVGGIVGSVNECAISINDSKLQHVVSKEDADIRIVSTTGGEATGGLIGLLEGSKTVDLNNVEVGCPVGGLNKSGDKVGGLIGRASISGKLSLNGCRVTSIVSGGQEIGGYFGYCKLSGNSQITVKGSAWSNYIVPDDSAAGIEGISQIGGAFGYYSGHQLNIEDNARIRIGINVDASDTDCGGAIGKLASSEFNLTVFNMSSGTMQVKGGKSTGGMIGYAEKSTITGNSAFDYVVKDGEAELPERDSFSSIFIGIVKGTGDTGGILGKGRNVSLKALTSGGSVSVSEGDNIGGIVGCIVTSGSENTLEDLSSASLITAANSSNVGGIAGYMECDDNCYFTDCINYGEIKGGPDTGGIVGHFHRTWPSVSQTGYYKVDLRWSVNIGEVSGVNRVGGIMGYYTHSLYSDFLDRTSLRIYKCGNYGHVSSGTKTEEASGIGGIIGYCESTLKLENNTNNATITSTASHKGVGGIAGSLGEDAFKDYRTTVLNVEVYSCINNGNIDSTDKSSRVGGILGFMEEGPDSYLKNCLNTGMVLNKHNSDNGGILGYVDHLGKIYDCFNKGTVEEGNATIGTHKTGSVFDHDDLYMLDGSGWTWPSAKVIKKEDLCNQAKFSGLDFENLWMMTDLGPVPRDCPFWRIFSK
ncbi:MAG: hypothetical protein K2L22_06195 [Muribaculaceae bacterium]|nr:hypothetical protein [Muribaculaceae bacterium]